MKPLIVLISTFGIVLLVIKIFRGSFKFAFSGRVAMSMMLIFTAIGHFIFTKGMSMMLPDFMPFKTEIIYSTGIIEVAAAVGLFIPNFRTLTAWCLIIFFILILPANIYASMHNIDYQKGNFNGNGLTYLYFRIPLQILFIAWTYFSTIPILKRKEG